MPETAARRLTPLLGLGVLWPLLLAVTCVGGMIAASGCSTARSPSPTRSWS